MSHWLEGRANARAFFRELRLLQERWQVLEHPFMRRWQDGRLSTHEVRQFAAQYGLAANALAEAATAVAFVVPTSWRAQLNDYAVEKITQREIWNEVLDELGVEHPTMPTRETRRCVSTWSRMPVDDPVVGLAVLFALESAQAATAPDLLDGPARHTVADAPSLTAYWQRQVQRAPAHAGALRCLLGPVVEATAAHQVLAAAEAALAAWWDLLNGVDQTAPDPRQRWPGARSSQRRRGR